MAWRRSPISRRARGRNRRPDTPVRPGGPAPSSKAGVFLDRSSVLDRGAPASSPARPGRSWAASAPERRETPRQEPFPVSGGGFRNVSRGSFVTTPMAVAVGFEPTVDFHPHTLSSCELPCSAMFGRPRCGLPCRPRTYAREGGLQRTRLRLRLGQESRQVPRVHATCPACMGMTRSEIGSRSSSASAVVVSIAADDRGPRLGGVHEDGPGPAVHDDACEGAARDDLDGQARHEGQRALQGDGGLPADPLPAMSRQTAKVGRMALGCSPEGEGTEATHSR